VLDKWAAQGVEGHFTQPSPWLSIDDIVVESSARLVGALPSEVVVMNSLTANLHFMMASFYRPTPERFKIITEKKAFPSDTHAVVSQLRLHGYDPATALIEVPPREGEQTLRDEDIIQVR
jgi:kynureninase